MFHYVLTVATCIILINSSYAYSPTSHPDGRLNSQKLIYPSRQLFKDYCETDEDISIEEMVNAGKYFCQLGLQGYYICGTYEFVKCPEHTKCGCHLKALCDMVNPCVSYENPYPMKPRASFRFHGKNSQNYYWYESSATKYALSGVVKQDVQNGKFLQIITSRRTVNTEGSTFQLIVPGETGTFIEYTGKRSGTCRKVVINRFKPFGYELGNFQLQSETSNLTHKTYYYAYEKLYDHWYWRAGRFEWDFETRVDPETKTMEPIKSHYFQSGEDDEFYFRFNQNVDWITSSLGSLIPDTEKWYANLFNNLNKDWFQVSQCCKYAGIVQRADSLYATDARILHRYGYQDEFKQKAKKKGCDLEVTLRDRTKKIFHSLEDLENIMNSYPMIHKCENIFHVCKYMSERSKSHSYYRKQCRVSKRYKKECRKYCGLCKKNVKCTVMDGTGDSGEKKINVGIVQNPAFCFDKCLLLMVNRPAINGVTYSQKSEGKFQCWCELGMTKRRAHKHRKNCIFE